MNNRILSLKPGEKIPEGAPRRYPNAQGYVRLRWKLGKGLYVETYEHRVRDGRVLDPGLQGHHKNRARDDNRPENIEPLTPAEHGVEHRQINRAAIVELLTSGLSQTTAAEILGCHSSNVSRISRQLGVETVALPPKMWRGDVLAVEAMLRSGDHTYTEICRHFGIGFDILHRIRRTADLPKLPDAYSRRTHCPQGHAYDEVNTIQRKRGGRTCRACKNAEERRRYHRKRSAA